MNKKVKGWLWAAVAMILGGLILFWGVGFTTGWDFSKWTSTNQTTKTYNVLEDFTHLSVDVNSDDILLVPYPSLDDSVTVVCPEREKISYSVSVAEDTLVIRLVDQRKWYDHISLFTPSDSVRILLPPGAYGNLTIQGDTSDVSIPKEFSFESVDISVSTGAVYCYASASQGIKIHSSTGSIRVEDVRASHMEYTVSTGSVTLSRVECTGEVRIHTSTGKAKLNDIVADRLISTGNTGDFTMASGTITHLLSVNRSTGDVVLNNCSIGQGEINTDTGDVEGSLLSPMVFHATTDTGSVDVPKTTTGGLCEITTDTGDIHITLS